MKSLIFAIIFSVFISSANAKELSSKEKIAMLRGIQIGLYYAKCAFAESQIPPKPTPTPNPDLVWWLKQYKDINK